jgi:uncharacterized protein (DUF58 family)
MQNNFTIAHDRLDERQFQLAVRRLADSLSFGSDNSPFLGAGIEFAQSRPYQFGDPIKFMDWRATARTGRFHIKEYEAPRRFPFYILMDTSASMCISSIPMSKYAWAVQLAAGVALAAQDRMSPVGILGCGERDLHVRPTLSRNMVYQWAHHLRTHDFLEATTVGRSVRELAPTLESRSVLMVISDMHDEDAIDALKLVAQEHECVVLQLQDPAERGRVGGGIFRAREAESNAAFVAHGRRKWLDQESQERELRLAQIDHLILKTDEEFLPKLYWFLKHRDCFGKGLR